MRVDGRGLVLLGKPGRTGRTQFMDRLRFWYAHVVLPKLCAECDSETRYTCGKHAPDVFSGRLDRHIIAVHEMKRKQKEAAHHLSGRSAIDE